MTFAETVAAAIRDFSEHGYDSEQRLEFWMAQLRAAADAQAESKRRMEDMLKAALRAVYERLVEREGVLKLAGVADRFTLQKVKPHLHAELSRRIMASANLIKINRTEAIEKTMRRFSGWATSVPKGGAADPQMRKTADDVKRSLAQLPYLERRVLIDQGHKLTATISDVVAKDGGAIAGRWFSHFRQAGYNYREDHKERDSRVFLIRDSWAQKAGFVKPGEAGYSDAITQPGEEPYCRCKFEYLFNLRDLPDDMLSAKGREELARVRVAAKSARA